MKANELRIGNLIYYNNKIREVESIHLSSDGEYYIRMKGIEVLDNVEKISNIPLTDETVIKLLRDNSNLDIDVAYFTMGYVSIYSYRVGDYIILRTPMYVHELQNLYFALTREELNVSEILK